MEKLKIVNLVLIPFLVSPTKHPKPQRGTTTVENISGNFSEFPFLLAPGLKNRHVQPTAAIFNKESSKSPANWREFSSIKDFSLEDKCYTLISISHHGTGLQISRTAETDIVT